MSRNKAASLILALILALFLVGCSADSLWNDGNKAKFNLGSAGLGTAGKRLVSEATESINGFSEAFDSCFTWDPEPFTVQEGSDKKLAKLGVSTKEVEEADPTSFDGNDRLAVSVREIVTEILKALESSESDEEIRKALAQPYKGVTEGGPVHRTMDDVISGIIGDDVLDQIEVLVGLFNEEAASGISRIRSYSVPMPISSYDFLILLDKVMTIVVDNVPLILKLINFDSLVAQATEESPKDLSRAVSSSYLKYIPDGIEANVGERDSYQTVGDKIAFAIIYDVFDTLDTIFDRFREDFGDNLDSFNPGWVVSNTADQFDRLISDLYVLGYIYSVHIEYAGFVGNLMKK